MKMAASMRESVMFFLCFWAFFSLAISHMESQCGLTSVQIVGEDGHSQEISLQPVVSDHCEKCANPLKSKRAELGYRLPGPEYTSIVYPIRVRAFNLSEIIPLCELSYRREPCGICDETSNLFADDLQSDAFLKKCVGALLNSNAMPTSTGNNKVDKDLAYGIVLANTGQYDDAIIRFTEIIKDYPHVILAYIGRGTAYLRKGVRVHEKAILELALEDFTTAIDTNSEYADAFVRKAEVLSLLNQHEDAIENLDTALQLKVSSILLVKRGREHMLVENFNNAESDFRRSLEMNSSQPEVLYFLALSLHGKGKVRNSIEVFKDVVKLLPNDHNVFISLGNVYRDLGEGDLAMEMLDRALEINPESVLALQLKGAVNYHAGNMLAAIPTFQKCLELSEHNEYCEYMLGSANLAVGQFFNSIKSHTKVIVYKPYTAVRLTPEYLKAYYLKEYARYLHARLDENLTSTHVEKDLHPEFNDRWVKLLPFTFQHHYQEQPGIQPSIADVSVPAFEDLPTQVQQLLCKADTMGELMRPGVDGFLNNHRLKMAMGLASIDIAQHLENVWASKVKITKTKNRKNTGWREIFNTAVTYRRLVNPDEPVVWLDQLPADSVDRGFLHENVFIKGHQENIRIMPYYELVFNLMKTMIQHFKGESILDYDVFEREVQHATQCHDLLQIARDHRLNQHGFLITTQVPSMNQERKKHEGVILTLTDTGHKSYKVLLSVSTTSSRSRMKSYQAELDVLFAKLLEEIRRSTHKVVDVNSDTIGNLILSLVYYFYNLAPLSKGTSAVAYAVAVGFFMSLGSEVTGKLPPGKLMQFEAMLSGAPDAFILVTKQWMKPKRSPLMPRSLPLVKEHLPTLRQVLEVLGTTPITC